MESRVFPICVIGGGSAGTMAALRSVLNNDDCLFFPGSPQDKRRSRALWVRKVENMPAHLQYRRGIEDPNAETLKWIAQSEFAQRLHLFKNTGVTQLRKTDEGHFEITDSKGQKHFAQYVVLCTGVMDVQPHIQGSIEHVFDYANAQTIDYCLICDGHHVLNKKTVVIGHGSGAAWVSIMLHERYAPPELTILTHGEALNFSEEAQKLIELYKFRVVTSPIKEIVGEDKGKVLKAFTLEDGSVISADVCFVSLGMIVYNELALQVGAEVDERGFVKAGESGESSISGLYVAGDLKAQTRKQIYTAWDTAVSALNSINLKLRSERRKKLLSST